MTGHVFDKASQLPVKNASVRNVMSGATIISKQDGSFIADVAEGNILAFSANGYYTDTLTITSKSLLAGELIIKLNPLPATLEDVTVTGNYNRYAQDSIARRKSFLETVGENKISAVGHPSSDKDFGVAINLDHFSSREKNKRKARSLFEITEEEAYINYRWNETVVEKYTGFKDDALTSFMQQSRPTYDWLRGHESEEDLLYYINNKLKKMKKNG